MSQKNFVAKVKECYTILGICKMELNIGEGNELLIDPGQFITIEPCNNRSVMPRPFSVVGVRKNIIDIIMKVVGPNTRAYSEMVPGEKIKVTGPLGNAVLIDEKVKNYILVGGGIGGAALIMLAKKLQKQGKNVIVFLGAKNVSELVGDTCYLHDNIIFYTITENDECGDCGQGYVTDLFEEMMVMKPIAITIACGPKPMLQKVAQICKKFDKKCYVMLEELMACGMGSCKGCAITDVDGNVKHVCSDGPSFDAAQIDWEKFCLNQTTEASKGEFLKDNSMQVALKGKKTKELKLEYPFMNASGCLGIEALEEGFVDCSKFGALVTKGVTVDERSGNLMPRTCETPAGMINSVGLENLGINRFVAEELDRWSVFKKPVIVNISGYSVEEYVHLARELSRTDITAIEINISCPNIVGGGMAFGTDLDSAFQITEQVLEVASNKFIIVKLTPNVTDVIAVAEAVVNAGADAISLINTVQAMAINVETCKPKIATTYGGLSGPAIRPIAVRMVHQIFNKNLGVPIIGMGGIEDGPSSAEFFIAGASAVAVGTGVFGNWKIFDEMNTFLKKNITKHGFNSMEEYIGSVVT